jgi:hypothetical protein
MTVERRNGALQRADRYRIPGLEEVTGAEQRISAPDATLFGD